MAKARRKGGGCKKGSFKLKKMGKGWSTVRKVRGRAKPPEKSKESEPKG